MKVEGSVTCIVPFTFIVASLNNSVAGPGFPVGGGVHLRRGHFSVKMYAKTKELGPIGAPPLDPPM